MYELKLKQILNKRADGDGKGTLNQCYVVHDTDEVYESYHLADNKEEYFIEKVVNRYCILLLNLAFKSKEWRVILQEQVAHDKKCAGTLSSYKGHSNLLGYVSDTDGVLYVDDKLSISGDELGDCEKEAVSVGVPFNKLVERLGGYGSINVGILYSAIKDVQNGNGLFKDAVYEKVTENGIEKYSEFNTEMAVVRV